MGSELFNVDRRTNRHAECGRGQKGSRTTQLIRKKMFNLIHIRLNIFFLISCVVRLPFCPLPHSYTHNGDGSPRRHAESKSLFAILRTRLTKTQVLSLSVFKNGPLKDGADSCPNRDVGNYPEKSSYQFFFPFEIPIFPPF